MAYASWTPEFLGMGHHSLLPPYSDTHVDCNPHLKIPKNKPKAPQLWQFHDSRTRREVKTDFHIKDLLFQTRIGTISLGMLAPNSSALVRCKYKVGIPLFLIYIAWTLGAAGN